MKAIKKFVYYCDYCKKHCLSSSAMKLHEKHCTGNPDRECRLCDGNGVADLRQTVLDFKAAFRIEKSDSIMEPEYIVWTNQPVNLDAVIEAADGCPACALAILRQTGMNHYIFDFQFDYMRESKKYFTDKINEETANYRESYCSY